MAHNETYIRAAPDRVFSVLSDAGAYPRWVVGAKALRDADPDFPAVGTRFHHKVGWGPLEVADHTEVIDLNPPYRLELRAKARPLGSATVTLLLEPRADGTYVTMIEDAGGALSRLLFNPLTQRLVHGRNVESLRRLKELVEREGRSAGAASFATSSP